MNEHRWVAQPTVPVKAQMNEDKKVFLKVGPTDPLDFPMQVWCFDCEEHFENVFGEECTGFMGIPGNKDKTYPDEFWSEL